MRLLPSDTYNVAWFKLAEFVTRGEKERALGLYRLLIHSFDDQALALQLHADLLWAFHDEQAFTLYQKAADTYQQSGKMLHAASVYEHLLTICPHNQHYIDTLERMYQKLQAHTQLATLYQTIVISHAQTEPTRAENYLEAAIKHTVHHADPQSYNIFLQRLEKLSPSLHKQALELSTKI